ncbi:MAG: aspartyl protease family protein [Desulfurococcales archaeon]|nr:aspartyl protease family protein [Desulfurococcales archaeon]
MGFIYVDVELRGAKSSKVIRMLVDTGSTYVVLSSDIIGELGLIPTPYTVDLTLADRRVVAARLFLAEARVKGRRGPVLVAELETSTPLLGVYALETLGFKVSPVTGEVEEVSPEGGYLLSH